MAEAGHDNSDVINLVNNEKLANWSAEIDDKLINLLARISSLFYVHSHTFNMKLGQVRWDL